MIKSRWASLLSRWPRIRQFASVCAYPQVTALWSVAIFLALAYSLTLAPALTWANEGADGGDLAAAVATWGVPHPTGYPSYVILGRAFLSLPVGEAAFRLAIFSAATMALAAGLMGCIMAAMMTQASPRVRTVIGVITGLTFGLAPIPWSQAVIAEVHGLHAFFLALMLTGVGLFVRAGDTRGVVIAALGILSGMAIGNHVTYVLVLPALIAVLFYRSGKAGGRIALVFMGSLVVGLMVYLYLPLAARQQPPINWGNASTWDGFLWLITGKPYQGYAFGLSFDEVLRRVSAWAGLLIDQFSVIGLILGVIGVVYGRSRARRMDFLTFWIVPIYSIFALGYGTADSTAYLIPAYLGFAWWIGLGLGVVARALESHRPSLGMPAAILILALILVRSPGVGREVSARSDHRAADFIRQVMRDAPGGAIVLTQGTEDSFALWYARFALEQRSDLSVIVAPLTQFAWYREQVIATYPDLKAPSVDSGSASSWLDTLISMNDQHVCLTEVYLDAELPRAKIECGLD